MKVCSTIDQVCMWNVITKQERSIEMSSLSLQPPNKKEKPLLKQKYLYCTQNIFPYIKK